jgi:hypothetical protein
MPDIAFSSVAPMEGGPFVTASYGDDERSRARARDRNCGAARLERARVSGQNPQSRPVLCQDILVAQIVVAHTCRPIRWAGKAATSISNAPE